VSFLGQLVASSRPVSWVNTAYPFAVAYWLNTGKISLTLVIGTLFFLVPYNLLMYGVNDVFDYESDLRNPRKGGIEGALLNPKYHRPTLWAAALSCVPFVVYLVVVGSVSSSLWLALFLFTVVAYSVKGLRFKEIPFLDSLTSASHFVGPMIFGVSLAGGDLTNLSLLMLIAAFAFWGAASHAFGAVQDVSADRAASISSIATVIGARATTRLATVLYLAACALVLAAGGPAAQAIVPGLLYAVVVARYWNITDATCEQANRGWRSFIWLNFFAGSVVTLLVLNFAASKSY
jgi:4-hydroxybenzoate polyprenyltransferase